MTVKEQFCVLYVGLRGGNVGLGRLSVGARLRDFFGAAPGVQSCDYLLLRCEKRLISRDGIGKALLYQLTNKLPSVHYAAFIHQQLVNALIVVKGDLHLANVDVAIDCDAVGRRVFPVKPAPDDETRGNKESQVPGWKCAF